MVLQPKVDPAHANKKHAVVPHTTTQGIVDLCTTRGTDRRQGFAVHMANIEPPERRQDEPSTHWSGRARLQNEPIGRRS